jgi:hypothetical protein
VAVDKHIGPELRWVRCGRLKFVETPSLPCAPFGKRSQPTATVLACLCRFRAEVICPRLPWVATTGLHKGSIVCSQIRQRTHTNLRRGTPCLLETWSSSLAVAPAILSHSTAAGVVLVTPLLGPAGRRRVAEVPFLWSLSALLLIDAFLGRFGGSRLRGPDRVRLERVSCSRFVTCRWLSARGGRG